jgi:hypothetical protein
MGQRRRKWITFNLWEEKVMKSIAKLLAATTAIGMATSAYAADMTLKFGHVGNPSSLFEASVDNFAGSVRGTFLPTGFAPTSVTG